MPFGNESNFCPISYCPILGFVVTKYLEMCICCGRVQTVLQKCFIQVSDFAKLWNMKELQEMFQCCVINLMSVINSSVCDKVLWTSKFHGMLTKSLLSASCK